MADKRVRRTSPIQLLIFLTIAGLVFSSLVVAGFLGWSLLFAVSLGAFVLTCGRLLKKFIAKLYTLHDNDLKQMCGNKVVENLNFYRVLDVYFAMTLVSGLCYSIGATAQWLI